jgi:transcription antitermination factor NusG
METTHETENHGAQDREWYALHTRARHEKAIAARLGLQETEVYLPLHRRRKKWRNGVHAEVDFPLLPCYLFARIAVGEQSRVLETPGVLGLAASTAQPTAISNQAIARLRAAAEVLKAEPHAYLDAGDRVRIVTGPLAGMEGILERQETACRVVLSFEPIHRAIAVGVEEREIEPAEGQG